MSTAKEIQSKVLSNMVLYILMGIGLYLLALFLGVILKLFFGFSMVSYGDIQVDVVTYIAYGSIDLILSIIQIFGTAFFVILVWIYNFFIIDVIFAILDGIIYAVLNVHTFGVVQKISEADILQLADAIALIIGFFSTSAFDILQLGSTVVEEVVVVFTGRDGGRMN